MIRLYVSENLNEGINLSLNLKQGHYLKKVMRRKLGDKIALFNGRDGEWLGEVSKNVRRTCFLKVNSQIRKQGKESDVWVVFSLLKRGPMDLLAEKASELGASSLLPVRTRRTNTSTVNVKRLQKIVIEAAEQCGRLTIPIVEEPQSLTSLLSSWISDRKLVLLDETGNGEPIAEVMRKRRNRKDSILIGPEGGFEPPELELIRSYSFITSASLGKRLVRAETAAIAALSNWQAIVGEWK